MGLTDFINKYRYKHNTMTFKFDPEVTVGKDALSLRCDIKGTYYYHGILVGASQLPDVPGSDVHLFIRVGFPKLSQKWTLDEMVDFAGETIIKKLEDNKYLLNVNNFIDAGADYLFRDIVAKEVNDGKPMDVKNIIHIFRPPAKELEPPIDMYLKFSDAAVSSRYCRYLYDKMVDAINGWQ